VKFKFCNKLLTPNNQTVFIPNGILSNGNITNYSLEKFKADLTFAISYDSDIKKKRRFDSINFK
jgi:small conductance mechanosensitive channel